MYQIVTGQKNLNDPVLGSRLLNRAGLHTFRVKLANWCNQRRRTPQVSWLSPAQNTELDASGVLAIDNFLPPDQFAQLSDEVEGAIEAVAATCPAAPGSGRGYGQKQLQSWGFDRFDGGTLNRFITVDGVIHPQAAAFSREPKLRDLTSAIAGGWQLPHHVWMYHMVHGGAGMDPQKQFHRDTFFSSVKFWFCMRPVGSQQGPFEYIKGSHKLTPERVQWEEGKLQDALRRPQGQRSASFRVSAEDTGIVGSGEVTRFEVAENTLIIADTFGFHRRGDAESGAERLALYGNMRPWPFSLWRHHR